MTIEIAQLEAVIEDGRLTEYGWHYAQRIAELVASRYYATEDVEELIQLAVCDLAVWMPLVEKNSVEGVQRPKNLKNVMFTRARNCMSNFMYRTRNFWRINGRQGLVSLENLLEEEGDFEEYSVPAPLSSREMLETLNACDDGHVSDARLDELWERIEAGQTEL